MLDFLVCGVILSITFPTKGGALWRCNFRKTSLCVSSRSAEKGQIVIPKGARDLFDIQPGDQLLLMADKKRGIALVDPGEVYLPPDMFPAKEDDNGNSEN